MFSSPVKTAIVGLGTIGSVHAELCASSVTSKVTVVCDTSSNRAQAVAAATGSDWEVDYRRVLERRDVDAVIIATPTHLHAPVAIEALEAGKSVGIEKPLARNVAEGQEIVAAAERTGLHAQYFENLCFSPAYRQAKTLVEAGALGDIFYVRCCENSGGGASMGVGAYQSIEHQVTTSGSSDEPLGTWFSDPDRSGGGMIISTACHCITYVYHVLDRRAPIRVYAETLSRNSADPRVEDAGYLMVRFAGDVVSHIESSAINALGTFDDRAEIYGTEGSILLNLYRSAAIKVYSQPGYSPDLGASLFGNYDRATTNWSYPIPDERHSLGYAAELHEFFHAIREDRPPDVTLTDGLVTLSVIAAAYESARTAHSVAAVRTSPPTGAGLGSL